MSSRVPGWLDYIPDSERTWSEIWSTICFLWGFGKWKTNNTFSLLEKGYVESESLGNKSMNMLNTIANVQMYIYEIFVNTKKLKMLASLRDNSGQ